MSDLIHSSLVYDIGGVWMIIILTSTRPLFNYLIISSFQITEQFLNTEYSLLCILIAFK